MASRNIEDISLLKITKEGDQFVLIYDGQPIKTAGGNKVAHKSDHLLKQMILQVPAPRKAPPQEWTTPMDLGDFGISTHFHPDGHKKDKDSLDIYYSFYSWQKDKLEKGQDDLDEALESCDFYSDRIFYLEEKERSKHPIKQIIEWLKINGSDLPNLLPQLSPQQVDEVKNYIFDDFLATLAIIELEPKDRPKINQNFFPTIRKLYLSLKFEERAFVYFWHEYTGDIVFPIAVVSGVCTIDNLDWLIPHHVDPENIFIDDPKVAYRYLIDYKIGIPDESILAEIGLGENKHKEFKSTLRYNLYTEKNDDEITYACLKTIAAFLNTDGGKLFIGISDRGEVLGIEKDGFPNHDKYQLHLYNLIKASFGSNIASLINTEIKEVEDKFICVVNCEKSKEPVYMKFKNNKDEEYFIRTGPGTTKLSTSEAHKYIKDKFE